MLTATMYYQPVHRALSEHKHETILSVNPPDMSVMQKIRVESQVKMTEVLRRKSLSRVTQVT
jgi:hypothetical protein